MQMHAGSMLPFASEPLSAEDAVKSWRAMIAECEQFYPAHLELGTRLVRTGKEAEGRQHLDRGMAYFVQFSEHPEEEVGALVENLERGWRFDLLRTLLERIVERWPTVGWFHDELAHAAARTGDFAKARSSGAKARDLEPESASFLSNLGLYALLEGCVSEAAAWIDQARKLDRNLDSTRRNHRAVQYLQEHGGCYKDYLLRPAPRAEFDQLANDEDWKALDRQVAELKDDRLEAFVQDAIARGEIVLVADQVSTLQILFNFVEQVSADAYFLYEDVNFMRGIFERLMNKFILKFRDADAQVIGDVCDALDALHAFFQQSGLVSARDLTAFRKKAAPARTRLVDRATRYRRKRTKANIDDDDREELRNELFGGDHFWPHI